MKNKSEELYKWQRGKEKKELFKRFRFRAIEEIYKKEFFNLFDNKCFKCGVKEKPHPEIGKPPVLCIDHHIPMVLGGHLVPGNLVSLCRKCNNKKHDSPPEEFYTIEELESLKPLLKQEQEIFNFNFDWELWDKDRKEYLLSLGVEPSLVQELLYNSDHRDFIGLPSDNITVTFKIDINTILNKINKR